MQLVLVESPTKARTLTRFLGEGYVVEATYGHVRDLPEKKIGLDLEDNFKPLYVQTLKQKQRVDQIKKVGKGVKSVILATDPDREGEAIAWHVQELLGTKFDFKRIVFHEITKTAVEGAMVSPGHVNMPLVHAQQARRVLDRIVGYKLSPLLWKKVRRGLSAGRVQSVALRLIVEKEREIEAFVAVEYWDLQVVVQKLPDGEKLTVKLIELNGEKLEVGKEELAKKIEGDLRATLYRVGEIEKKDFSRTPPAPFTTSTLQQTAANRLGWSAKKTMQVAQGLYEEGNITYHRTDSTNLASDAVNMARDYVTSTYGREYALETPRLFKTKSKVAQEAHEAIRPTDVRNATISDGVANRDQQRLYELIWKRFVACQVANATGENMKVMVSGESGESKYGLEARGETITFDGWYRVTGKDTEENILLEGVQDEELKFVDMKTEQKFTQAPARFNDASLIKALEEMGIGRPSTYAPTISTIQERQYVERIEKRFKPTELGIAVNDFLVKHFSGILDYKFTARMEDDLDEIANGEKEWQPVIADFYGPFAKNLAEVTETAEKVKIEVEETGNPCPKCQAGREIIRIGRFGRFLACSRFPDCDYKANFQNKIGMKCPKCIEGEVIMRKTRSGKTFFGCSNYPKCDFASWNKPQASPVAEAKPVV